MILTYKVDLDSCNLSFWPAKKNQFQETIVEEVVEMARDKENWQLEANALQRKPRTDISLVSNTYNISRLNTNTTITHSYNLRTRKCRT